MTDRDEISFLFCSERREKGKRTYVESLVFRVEPNVGFDRADSVRERLVHGHVSPVVVVRVDLALRAVLHEIDSLRTHRHALAHFRDVARESAGHVQLGRLATEARRRIALRTSASQL